METDIHHDPNFTIQKVDVFGEFDFKANKKISDGMVVASGKYGENTTCPVFGDDVPWKSVTVICKPEQESEVVYWLGYVHGGGNISNRRVLDDGRIALRSNYMAW